MNVREFIQKLETEKRQIVEENKQLRSEVEELKRINKGLVNELNSYVEQDIKEVASVSKVPAEKPIDTAVEPDDEQKIDTPVEEVEPKEVKPKRGSRKKKSDLDELV